MDHMTAEKDVGRAGIPSKEHLPAVTKQIGKHCLLLSLEGKIITASLQFSNYLMLALTRKD